MKIFAIYTSVTVLEKPYWLDGFKREFGDPAEYHITLVQPRFVNDTQIPALTEQVERCIRSTAAGKIPVTFSEPVLDRGEPGNGCIMVAAREPSRIRELRDALIAELSGFDDYVQDKYRVYEDDFMPHITIGCDLDTARFDQAAARLPENVLVSAVVEEVVLAVVADQSAEERTNPDNQRRFYL